MVKAVNVGVGIAAGVLVAILGYLLIKPAEAKVVTPELPPKKIPLNVVKVPAPVDPDMQDQAGVTVPAGTKTVTIVPTGYTPTPAEAEESAQIAVNIAAGTSLAYAEKLYAYTTPYTPAPYAVTDRPTEIVSGVVGYDANTGTLIKVG